MSKVNVFDLLDKSKKNMKGVNQGVQDLALELVKQAYHRGIYVQITDGFRSFAAQTKLYNQGRTTKGNIVTNAKAGQSIHNYGYAVDYALVDKEGKLHWNLNQNQNSNARKDWFEVADLAKKLGFAWGGDWISFKDYPHLEIMGGLRLGDMQKGKKPVVPAVKKRDYLGVGDSGKGVVEFQKWMNTQGYKLTVDGAYGEQSEKALKDFQEKHGLVADGIFGKKSKEVLQAHNVKK